MDIQEIKQLIKIVEKSDINEIELEEEGRKIRISKQNSKAEPGSQGPGMYNPMYFSAPSPPQLPEAAPRPAAVEPAAPPPASSKNLVEVRSPMVGTFYRSPSPDSDSYVEVGSMVKAGNTLCIIEAMKLMNEIEAEHAGKIVKIVADNAQPVEYNQVLFIIDKDA